MAEGRKADLWQRQAVMMAQLFGGLSGKKHEPASYDPTGMAFERSRGIPIKADNIKDLKAAFGGKRLKVVKTGWKPKEQQ